MVLLIIELQHPGGNEVEAATTATTFQTLDSIHASPQHTVHVENDAE